MNRALVDIVSKYFETQPIEKAWLFGSYARSEQHGASDIDILVNFLPGARITLFRYVHMVNELQQLTGKKVDLVENGQLKEFAITSSVNDKILIYERKS
jgi:predicted nucleotidyltransferase